MRIAVVGAGGIGGIYAARLAHAGAEVIVVARGAHLAAIRANGLRLEGDLGEAHVTPALATDDFAAPGPVDVVLSCVKLWDVEAAGAAMRPLVGSATAVVALQNGVDAHDRLLPILGRAAVMGGSAFVSGLVVAPGVIRQTGIYQRMTFGELDGSMSARGRALAELCVEAGIEPVFSPNILVPLWQKFLVVVPLANINALTRASLGQYRADPDLWALVEGGLRETEAVGRAEGVALDPDIAEETLATFRAMPAHHMTAMCNDLLRGNRLELPWFAGKVVELGRRHGIPTPVNAFVYAALKLYRDGAPKPN